MSVDESGQRDPATQGFDPKAYRPQRADGVIVLDRGEDVDEDRFVLADERTQRTVVLDAPDKIIWDMFDGKSSVSDICADYLTRYRTLALRRVYSLLQRLWENGFLREDPQIASSGPSAGRRRWRLSLVNWLRMPVPGSSLAVRLWAVLLRPLQLARTPVVALFILAVAVGAVVAGDLDRSRRFPILKISRNYLGAASLAAGAEEAEAFEFAAPGTDVAAAEDEGLALARRDLKRDAYVLGVFLLFALHLVFSFLRESFQAGVAAAFGARPVRLRLVLNYGVPAFWHVPTWRLGLPDRQRVLAASAGLGFELLLAGVCAVLLQARLPVLYLELLYKAMWVLYLRSFLNLAPLAASDFQRILGEAANITRFRPKAISFLRRNLVKAMLGDARLSREQRSYLAYNLVSVGALIFAARFGLDLLASNQQTLRDINFTFAGDSLMPALLLSLMVLPVMLGMLMAIAWGLYLLWQWLAQQRLLDDPLHLLASGIIAILMLLLTIEIVLWLQFASVAGIGHALYCLSLLTVLGALAFLTRRLKRMHASAIGLKVLLQQLILICGALAMVMPRLPNVPFATLVWINGLLAFTVVVYHLLLLGRRQHLFALLQTRLLLPEMLATTGSVVLFLVGLYNVANAQGLVTAPLLPIPVFLGLAALALGSVAFMIALERVETELSALSVPDDDGPKSVAAAVRFVLRGFGRVVGDKLGPVSLWKLERAVGKECSQTAFFFENPPSLGGADAKAVDARGRAYLVSADRILGDMYGQGLCKLVFGSIFYKVGWESKQLLDEHICPGTRWEGRFTNELEATRQQRRELIDGTSMFNGMGTEVSEFLVSHMSLRHLQPGDLVIQQGTYGRSWYILVRGSVQIEEEDASGERRILSFLRAGDAFGEAALLENTPRMASVRAISSCALLRLQRSDFLALAKDQPALASRIRDRLRTLRMLLHVGLFSDLPPALLRQLLPSLKSKRYKDGEKIIARGDIGKEFYLIKSGQVDVLAQRGETEEKICDLGPLDYFGEIALLKDIPRTADVRSVGQTDLLVLAKDDFLQLTAGSDVFAANVGRMGDVRLEELQRG